MPRHPRENRMKISENGGFEATYRELWEILMRNLRRGGLSHHDAEEVAQEAIIKVLAGEAVDRSGQEIDDVRAFACGVARRVLSNYRRRAERRQCVPLEGTDRPTIGEDGVETDDLVGFVFANLDGDEADLLIDRYWRGLTYEQMGSRRGVSPARAFALLRSVLDKAKRLVA